MSDNPKFYLIFWGVCLVIVMVVFTLEIGFGINVDFGPDRHHRL